MAFKFELGDSVYIRLGKLAGEVRGRAEYSTGAPNQYSVHHLDGSGDPVYKWFDEDDLIQ